MVVPSTNLSDSNMKQTNSGSLRLLARGGGGALQLPLYGGVWPQDWKIDPSAD